MKATFVLGTMEFSALRNGEALTEFTYGLLRRVADEFGLEADLVFVSEDEWDAGKTRQQLKMDFIRSQRGRVLDEIGNHQSDVVICFGPVATMCIFDRGNMVEGELLRKEHRPLGNSGPRVFVTYGMENVRGRPGLAEWVSLDVRACIYGQTVTEWGNYTILQPDAKEWHLLPPPLEGANIIGFDLETYPGVKPWAEDARIRMAIVSDQVGRAWVIQAGPSSELPEWLIRMVEDERILKCGSNIKFDYLWMRRFGYRVVCMWDTSTAEHILDESNPKKDLKSLTFRYVPKLGDYSAEQRALVKARKGWEHVLDHEMYQYAGADGEASVGTFHGQNRRLRDDGLVRAHQLMVALYPVLCDMEYLGACISLSANRDLDRIYTDKLVGLRDQIIAHLGPINLNSHKQLAEALKRVVPTISLTVKQLQKAVKEAEEDEAEEEETTTKKSILEREAHKHPVIALVLEYRKYHARYKTFVKGIYEKHAVRVGQRAFIHPSFNTAIVETFRLSSTNPNGQNIPRKDNDDPSYTIKRQFVSRFEGGSILEADMSQLEVRLVAWLSHDPAFVRAVTAGDDTHREVAAQIHNKAPADVTEEERYWAKRQTFGMIYGIGEKKLALDAKVSPLKARQMIKLFFDTFPVLKAHIDKTHAAVVQSLQVDTPFGFRRRFAKPDHWRTLEAFGILRQAFNTDIQNTAACVVYCSMIWLHKALIDHKLYSKIVLQVHDSIVVDVCPGEEEQVIALVKYAMESPAVWAEWGVHIDVPLRCDIGIGPNWGELKEHK